MGTFAAICNPVNDAKVKRGKQSARILSNYSAKQAVARRRNPSRTVYQACVFQVSRLSAGLLFTKIFGGQVPANSTNSILCTLMHKQARFCNFRIFAN